MRRAILQWMTKNDWYLRHTRTYKFFEWVVMPKDFGGRLGFRNWLKWVMR